jgi:putative oxidoreductase
MQIFESSHSEATHRMLSVLRIVIGMLFLEHGTQKLFGFPPGPIPPFSLLSQLGISGMLETFGGLAIVLGLLTRPVAFLLCGEMAVAYFQVHFPKSPFPLVNGGEPAVLFCFIFLFFVFAGAGEWSLDAVIVRARKAHRPTQVHDRSYAHSR